MIRIFAVLLGMCAAAHAHALTITPITLELSAAGKETRAVITITNPTNEPAAIEPMFERVTIGENGTVTREAVSADNFLLMPLQSVLPPGAAQTFRLQWIGPPDLPQSESYYITFNQLPVQGLARRTGVTLLTSFSVAVNVSPASGRSAVQLVSTGMEGTRPTITVQNPTATHALLKYADITINAADTTIPVPRHAFEQMYGNGLLQPWSKRTFTLPIDLPAHVGPISAALHYEPPQR